MADLPSDYPVARWIATAAQLPFAQLSEPYQKAIVHYMAFDGEAWPNLWEPRYGMGPDFDATRFWREQLPEYVRRYGQLPFAVCELPLAELATAIMRFNDDIAAHGHDWESYCAWYRRERADEPHRGAPAGSSELWPVILDSDHPDVLQDGWHRLNDYVHRGLTTIPAVGYLPDVLYDDGSDASLP